LEQAPRNNDEQCRCSQWCCDLSQVQKTTNNYTIRHCRVVFAGVKKDDKLGLSFFTFSGASAKK